jgi:Flp pilus assembly pilin Flp
MRQLLVKLWKDDGGALIATEWVFVATILVLGCITGLVAVRQAVTAELEEFASAVLALNQSYSFTGLTACDQAATAGSQFTDTSTTVQIGSVPPADPSTATADPCD